MSTAYPRPRSSSRSRSHNAAPPPYQPTTPLRPSSRSSLRSSHHQPFSHSNPTGSSPTPYYSNSTGNAPAINTLEPQFAELADSMADLEANFMHLQLLHESLARFGECFASFLYGLEVRAFCVDFPEAPIKESLKRAKYPNPSTDYSYSQSMDNSSTPGRYRNDDHYVSNETTFMTTDTSFIENPVPSTMLSKTSGSTSTSTNKYFGEPTPVTPGPSSRRGGAAAGRARGGRAGASTSGIARGGRGTTGIPRGGATRGSGLPRGRGVSRGVR